MDALATAWDRVVDDRRRLAVLAGGDLAVVLGVVLAGELSHGVDPLAEPLLVADTLVPFLVGWAVAAAVLAPYDPGRMTTALGAARAGAGTWLAAANVGLLLRASPYFHGGVTWPFPLVVTGFVLVPLVAWRVTAGRFLSAGSARPRAARPR